ncbi:DUF2627 domain-containing protein [Ferviditalea candida]|uniref:DUF2627 domain-containing protein n=1 Tax=Ferviditalea candida TaxID=3108399 RepID=A0ABU5ZLV9_9BACL|nr:DUF2627 domain-containing protein [Paenibacillaceae bacterium T2]
MLQILYRFIAVVLLVVPGIVAAYGFILMKDAVFESFGPPVMPWGKFLLGILFFLIGVFFVGGWIFYRDRKRNYVAPRFKEKRNKK